MMITQVKILSISQKSEILKLWNAEYPYHLKHKNVSDFEAYLNSLLYQNHLFLIEHGEIKGWLCEFDREGERWFAMILDSEVHGKGYGSKLLQKAKENSLELNGWVIDHNKDKKENGEIYHSPIQFYEKNGFIVDSTSRMMSGELSAVKIHWQKTLKVQ